MPDLDFQQFSTVQSLLQPKPVTMAAALAITPTTFLTIVTGTTAIATITPPVSGSHMLAIVATATNFSGFTTAGNIAVASLTNSTVWDNKLSLFVWNPLTNKYHPNYAVLGTNF